jgi:hypothetical protein
VQTRAESKIKMTPELRSDVHRSALLAWGVAAVKTMARGITHQRSNPAGRTTKRMFSVCNKDLQNQLRTLGPKDGHCPHLLRGCPRPAGTATPAGFTANKPHAGFRS